MHVVENKRGTLYEPTIYSQPRDWVGLIKFDYFIEHVVLCKGHGNIVKQTSDNLHIAILIDCLC